jgi:putative ATPase
VGKTTLARLLAAAFDLEFMTISAVLGGVKDIRDAVAFAHQHQPRGTLVFVDEVHRFNKAQQDAFLPHMESGLFTLVGATTENPSFEVNSALLSRAAVHVLRRLDSTALQTLAERAFQVALPGVTVTEEGMCLLVDTADGDGRRLLNLIDALAPTTETTLDRDAIAGRLGERVRQFDQGGDAFYDQISALHKSVRGSDPNASLYWLARMLDGGADPRYVARRMVRMAAEDIGLADPRALRLALDAADTWERLGSPEGDLALAMAVTYLAVAPKSNAVYKAWKGVQAFVRGRGSDPVPDHLRNAPTRLMSDLGYGHTYRYAHDEPHGYAAGESYLPRGLDDLDIRDWYEPTDRGLESRIQEKLERLRQLDQEYEWNQRGSRR